MGRPPWTPLRCSPSIPAALLHASSSGTWWGLGGGPGWRQGFGGGPQFLWGPRGLGGGTQEFVEGDMQLFGGTEQFAGGWQGFGGTQEFEGTQVSETALGVFWGDPERTRVLDST